MAQRLWSWLWLHLYITFLIITAVVATDWMKIAEERHANGDMDGSLEALKQATIAQPENPVPHAAIGRQRAPNYLTFCFTL